MVCINHTHKSHIIHMHPYPFSYIHPSGAKGKKKERNQEKKKDGSIPNSLASISIEIIHPSSLVLVGIDAQWRIQQRAKGTEHPLHLIRP